MHPTQTMTSGKRWMSAPLLTLLLALTLLLIGCSGPANPAARRATTPAATSIATATASVAPLHGTITRTLRLADAPAACPIDAAWSPSGGQLAVLATRDTCLVRPAAKMPDLIIIYDAHSGAIVRQISLAAALARVQADVMIEPGFGFSGVSWSPDGSMIVVPFFQYIVYSSDPRGMGILVISPQGGSVRALAGPSNFAPSPVGFHPRFVGATVWNVRAGAPACTVEVPLTTSPTYQWSADGHITPALSATPTNGSQFSYWQPGFIAAVPTNSQSAANPVWFFSTAAFTRWSPDSRYVATGLMTMNQAGRTDGAPSTIAPENCRDESLPQPCFDQMIPTPDAAFRTVMARMKVAALSSPPLYPNDAPVVWRPDGAVLATVLPRDDGSGAQRAITISLLDTASGQVIGSVVIPIEATQGDIGMARWPYFSWSPAGHQLAVVNAIDNTVEVVAIA